MNSKAKGIYRIHCSCGWYIGETGRSLIIKFSEHQHCLTSGLLTHSAVPEHHHQTGHQTLFDSTSTHVK